MGNVYMLSNSARGAQETGVHMRFDGKVAIVTGSGGGIGEGYAKRLAAAGVHGVVAHNKLQGPGRVAKEIGGDGGDEIAVSLDIGDDTSPPAMAQAAIDAYGGIDYLVNNAAIYGGMRNETLLEVAFDYYQHFMNVNLNGALRCTRACYRSMAER